MRVAALVPLGSPAFDAGLDREDVIVAVGGMAVTSEAELRKRLAQGKPGDELPIAFERHGERVSSTIRLAQDPRREVVPVEDAGQTLTAAQKRFRDAWLAPAATAEQAGRRRCGQRRVGAAHIECGHGNTAHGFLACFSPRRCS